MVTLSEILPVEAVRLGVSSRDWRDAVQSAGELLTLTGTSTDEYTAEMIRNVEENGPYIVIAPGFAFAHARPSPAVLRTGMSWVRLDEPVEFGHESNDPVELVVALAARDASEHTAAMGSLARLLADEGRAAQLRAARTPRELHALLSGQEGADRPGSAAHSGPAADRTASGADRGAVPTGPVAEGPAGYGGSADGGARPADGGGARPSAQQAPAGVHKILTVCGNGVGTSLFLKNTLEQVLDRWGWSPYVNVEATDTISARGKASEAVALYTSGEIARALGDLGVPVKVVEDFTSTREVDAVLRDTYDV
ncbi:PTS sugar transporter subunit IIA [Streptomyces sp. XM4193]|uniref:PTS sugar transporter subunit IIA n=1 Tax=Streptomyces sp. XM4193 TaxID=2929782 RepID=UPI001FF70231|nr:PTS sugar transporter subunit IIA [Streptomyces sp. XM4193]MCK1797460.1 PTS sugar transporter subunit IIA [Streptomyces sp. XM4193]